eukprot:3067245-Pleurochrysis_carterae.AAC.1
MQLNDGAAAAVTENGRARASTQILECVESLLSRSLPIVETKRPASCRPAKCQLASIQRLNHVTMAILSCAPSMPFRLKFQVYATPIVYARRRPHRL